jgi:hypothetical protein
MAPSSPDASRGARRDSCDQALEGGLVDRRQRLEARDLNPLIDLVDGRVHGPAIPKGTKPGDIPVEQPTKFELIINMKAVKSLDLAVPPAVLLRADQVIE